MVIENFRYGPEPVYSRLAARGRMMPEGLRFIDSWLAADGTHCYQLMETRKPELFSDWIDGWSDLVDFDIVEIGEKPATPPNGR